MKWLQAQVAFPPLQPTSVTCSIIIIIISSSPSVQLMNAHPEKAFIRNKAAQVFALTFVMEYLALWPKFFFDILSLVGLNPLGVDIYLRTLMAIDAEVVDRDIVHSHEVSVWDGSEKPAVPPIIH